MYIRFNETNGRGGEGTVSAPRSSSPASRSSRPSRPATTARPSTPGPCADACRRCARRTTPPPRRTCASRGCAACRRCAHAVCGNRILHGPLPAADNVEGGARPVRVRGAAAGKLFRWLRGQPAAVRLRLQRLCRAAAELRRGRTKRWHGGPAHGPVLPAVRLRLGQPDGSGFLPLGMAARPRRSRRKR